MTRKHVLLTSTATMLIAAARALAAVPSPVVDTGQAACYDDRTAITCPGISSPFYGQDAQLVGNPPAYAVNGDGTVTDLNTGIMWQQGYAPNKLTYAEAQQYLEQINAQRFAGYDDWRLPTIKQLYSLIDFRGTDPRVESTSTAGLVPFIDTDVFQFAYGDTAAGERIIDSQWVTTTLYVANTNQMFGVNFADGRIKAYPVGMMGPQGFEKTYYVRLCRGNTDYGTNSFVDNGDGTVSDDATGLMWAKADSARGMSWEDALAWAAQKNAENYLGHDDWRVPDAKELHSLLDYSRSPDTTSSAAIDPVFQSTAITNEYGATDYPFYWSSTTFLSSDGSAGMAVYVAFGRGLGYMNGQFVDIHGAGCQRSDPKDGDPSEFPRWGFGPQGDVQRAFNFVRLVRDVDSSGTTSATSTYWVEIAANLDGEGGIRWRTDLALRNASASEAEVTITLHGDSGAPSLSNTIQGSAQAVWEDVVGLLGVTDKGTLEIESSQPLSAVARIYNQTDQGTFGQSLQAREEGDGLAVGEGAWLLGLRQQEGSYRTNITVANTSTEPATAAVKLYSTDGSLLSTYTLDVASASVVQDLQPFSNRAGRSSLGWGFARLDVVAGSGVLCSASVIDARTGDATTVSMKQ